MSPENRARVDAICAEVSSIADRLNHIFAELLDLRDEMRGTHDEPEPMLEAA